MSLPDTTVNDLIKMGVTLDSVKEKFKNLGWDLDDGDLSLEVDGPFNGNWWGYGDHTHERRERAKNYLVQDWTVDRVDPPRIVSATEYSEEFTNFDGTEPVSHTYHRSHSVTTTTDYTLTKSFDVSVNASVPLGAGGAALGFSASEGATEVAHRSTTDTTAKDVTHQFATPAGEGVVVRETTKVVDVTTTYRARIGVRGAVGVTRDPGFFDRNVTYGGVAALVAPGAGDDALVARTDRRVEIVVQKLRVPHRGAEPVVDELRGTFVGAGVHAMAFMASTTTADPTAAGAAAAAGATTRDVDGADGAVVVSAMFVPIRPLACHVHFSHEIPQENRVALLVQFVGRIKLAVQPLAVNGQSAISLPQLLPYTPDSDDAVITLRYDDAMVTRGNLTVLIAGATNAMAWGGAHMVTFV